MQDSNKDTGQNRLTILQMIKSVLGAFFGVQKSEIRERDFTKGRPIDFIIVGLLFTIVFVLGIVALVNIIMYFAGL